MRKRDYDDILTEVLLRELYVERGMTLDELHAHFCINRSTIAKYLKRHGIARRPLGSWMRTHAFDERFFERIDSYSIVVPAKGIIEKDSTGWMRIQNKQTLREVRTHLYRDGTLWLERKKELFFSI